jgi:hypothetical protein
VLVPMFHVDDEAYHSCQLGLVRYKKLLVMLRPVVFVLAQIKQAVIWYLVLLRACASSPWGLTASPHCPVGGAG